MPGYQLTRQGDIHPNVQSKKDLRIGIIDPYQPSYHGVPGKHRCVLQLQNRGLHKTSKRFAC
uniref:Nfat activating molecule with ITAM motif 1 n=1 Tax=Mus musculus TaxID=10090 RepID=A0A2R8VI11_MOUSE